VPAYAAAAASVGAELTVPELVQSVVVTRTQARSTAMPASEELAAFATTGATLALHLAITRTRELAEELAAHYGADCPVVVAYRVSQPGEIMLRGTLADIADAVEAANLRQAAVILVGRALAENVRGSESFLYDPERDRSRKRAQR
jgi:precorrin-4/cobalt-precorrin-4 C11-methyltransferase